MPSFRLARKRCPHCGTPDTFPTQTTIRTLVDLIVFGFIFCIATGVALGVAFFSVWLFRLIIGKPNAGLEFGVMVFALSASAAVATASIFCPMASGKVVWVHRTDKERRKVKLTYAIRIGIGSAAVVGLFVLWQGQDQASKIGLIVFWILWLCVFAYPYIQRLSRCEWQHWQPTSKKDSGQQGTNAGASGTPSP
jgi:hypothetical protein